jgi:hypothetical protein
VALHVPNCRDNKNKLQVSCARLSAIIIFAVPVSKIPWRGEEGPEGPQFPYAKWQNCSHMSGGRFHLSFWFKTRTILCQDTSVHESSPCAKARTKMVAVAKTPNSTNYSLLSLYLFDHLTVAMRYIRSHLLAQEGMEDDPGHNDYHSRMTHRGERSCLALRVDGAGDFYRVLFRSHLLIRMPNTGPSLTVIASLIRMRSIPFTGYNNSSCFVDFQSGPSGDFIVL